MAEMFGPTEIDTIVLDGGLDQITPLQRLPGGFARESLNFEVSTSGGYSLVDGYERFDGRPNPSDASWTTAIVASVTGLAVGDTLTGATSGAHGVIALITGNDVTTTKQSGEFLVVETLSNGTVTTAVTATSSADPSAKYVAQRQYAAAEIYRSDIQRVPGSGTVWVMRLNGVVYALRNNTTGVRKALFRATPTGWQQISLGSEIYFNTGVSAINDGDTITDLVTGGTGVVARVVLTTGVAAWGAGNATGKLIISSHVGQIATGHALQVGGVTRATSTTGLLNIDLAPGGTLSTDKATFGGAFNGAKLYCADGVSRAFEFNGTTVVPIDSGMGILDKPQIARVFKSQLFLAFGPSLQFSGINTPYIFSPLFGAGELAMNGPVTELNVQAGDQTAGSMVVYSEDEVAILYGNSSLDFKLSTYNSQVGAEPFTGQNLAEAYALDARGVIKLTASLNYGNFDQSTLTSQMLPFVKEHRGRATCSAVSRDKSQYRVFYSDGFAIYVTVANGELKGCMPVYFPDPLASATSGEQDEGGDAIYAGSVSGGFVYRLDAGTSFDGADIPFYLLLTYAAQGNARRRKRYRKGALEIVCQGFAKMSVGYDLGYSDATRVAMVTPTPFNKNPLSAVWDSGTWDSIVWDGRALGPVEVPLNGTAENIAMRIYGSSGYTNKFTINSVEIHWSPRRLMR